MVCRLIQWKDLHEVKKTDQERRPERERTLSGRFFFAAGYLVPVMAGRNMGQGK